MTPRASRSVRRRRRCSASGRPRDELGRGEGARSGAAPAARDDGHRPHPLGDLRRTHREQRAPAGGLLRAHRGHPQRDHRESRELRHPAACRGHTFTSDTDTEVVAHLVEASSPRARLADAVTTALPEVGGALLHRRARAAHPDLIVAARRGSPLVVGRTESGRPSSRATSRRSSPDERPRPVEDDEVARPAAGGVRVRGLDGALVEPTVLSEALGRRDREQGRAPGLHDQGDPRAAPRGPPDGRCAAQRGRAQRDRRARG